MKEFFFLHLTISLVRSCQYVSACQTLSKYIKRFKSYSDFHKLFTDGRMDGHDRTLLRVVQFTVQIALFIFLREFLYKILRYYFIVLAL